MHLTKVVRFMKNNPFQINTSTGKRGTDKRPSQHFINNHYYWYLKYCYLLGIRSLRELMIYNCWYKFDSDFEVSENNNICQINIYTNKRVIGEYFSHFNTQYFIIDQYYSAVSNPNSLDIISSRDLMNDNCQCAFTQIVTFWTKITLYKLISQLIINQ